MAIADLLKEVKIPNLIPVRQHFAVDKLEYPDRMIANEIMERGLLTNLRPGARIGITAGSRGVSNLPAVIRMLARLVREAGGAPFIFPAMGSHGGATAEGQLTLLKKLGVTEEEMGAPIESSMEVVQVGNTVDDTAVYMDRLAWESDGVIVANRIKPHTSFRGTYESGMVKMMVIGMGKQKGAEICHQLGLGGIAARVEAMSRVVLATQKVLFGVGSVENAFHDTVCFTVATPHEFFEKEKRMLAQAWDYLPRIPFDKVDVLIMDEIGKEISGTGFDTNAVNRFWTPEMRRPDGSDITRVAVLNLTDRSGGNANGIGMADVITAKAFERMSFEETYPNALTSTATLSVKVPMVMGNDRMAIQAAMKMSCVPNIQAARVVRIKNTLRLDRLHVSPSLLQAVEENPALEILGPATALPFDEMGNLSEKLQV